MSMVLLTLVLVAVAAAIVAFLFLKRPKTSSAQPSTTRAQPSEPRTPDPVRPAPAAPAPAVPAPAVPAASNPIPVIPTEVDADLEAIEITQVGVIPPELRQQLKDKLAAASSNAEEDVSVDVDLDGLEGSAAEEATGTHVLILVSGHARSDRGMRRQANEDAYLVIPDEPLFVVADGMGGHAAGDVASKLAVDTIERAFKEKTFVGAGTSGWPRRADELVCAIKMANEAVHSLAVSDPKYTRMGTTVVAARFSPNKKSAYIAHVGDSRCYRIRGGKIFQLTEDQTVGRILGVTGRRARDLAQAVGVGTSVSVEVTMDRPEPDDYYLICSDGLTKMVPDDVLLDFFVKDTHDLRDRAKDLIDEANRRGGRDNISVIAIRVERPSTSGFERVSQMSEH